MRGCKVGAVLTNYSLQKLRQLRDIHRNPSRLGRVATSDKATIVFEKQPDVKMRVTSGPWDGDKVILRDQVVEGRNVDGQLHVARKERRPDEWDPPIEPYVPMGEAIQGRLCDGSRCGVTHHE
jgi:hypothetical protein